MVFLAIGPGTGTQVMGLKCFFIGCLESFKSLHCKIGGFSVGGFDQGGDVMLWFLLSSRFELSCLIIFILLQKCRWGSDELCLREALHLLMLVENSVFRGLQAFVLFYFCRIDYNSKKVPNCLSWNSRFKMTNSALSYSFVRVLDYLLANIFVIVLRIVLDVTCMQLLHNFVNQKKFSLP